ncbi:MAG TPA: ribonuclease HI [Planctomycetota bacterium]|nr:ribonuclease HI [Planctomycetota bacterium]
MGAHAATGTAGSAGAAAKPCVIYTDGGCWNNPGPGAWAALVIDAVEGDGKVARRLIGGAKDRTTNNQMEIQAAIEALRATAKTDPGRPVEMYVDSEYLKNGATTWIKDWKRRGWRTASKQPVKNQDLWEALDAAMAGRDIRWNWVRGHVGHHGNEMCDQLTQMLIQEFVDSGKRRDVTFDYVLKGDEALTPELFARNS